MSGLALMGLSVLVARGVTDDLDDSVRQVFRPDDVWSTNQLIFGNVVDGLGPPYAAALLLLTGLFVAHRQRSARPVVFVVLLVACAAVLTAMGKMVVGRSDPHGGVSELGGAFPSGHMVVLMVSLGGVLLLLQEHPRWWHWSLVALIECTMGVSLLFLAMHWFTDVVGGGLLGLLTVAVAGLHRSGNR